jgi:exonuclease III
MTWNANSVRGKKLELLQFLNENKCDLCLLSETFLKPHTNFKLANMSTYRNDRQTHGGGTAILVRRGVTHHEVVLPPLGSLEATAVIIETDTGPLRVISVYKSPRTPLDTADLDKIFSDPTPTLVAGDLNSKHPAWNSRLSNASGKLLFRHASGSDYLVMGPDTPTPR